MKGIRKLVRDILGEWSFFTAPGTLYHEAKLQGYEGTQSELIKEANKMVKEGQIRGRRRGVAQNVWYAPKLECSELEGVVSNV